MGEFPGREPVVNVIADHGDLAASRHVEPETASLRVL